MHEPSNQEFVDASVAQPLAVGMSVPVWCGAKMLRYFQSDALTGSSMGLVELGQAVHGGAGLRAKVDESERMRPVQDRDLVHVLLPDGEE